MPESKQFESNQTRQFELWADSIAREVLGEKKKITKKNDPCWDGYHMVGTKKKDGREVPNCVPGKKG